MAPSPTPSASASAGVRVQRLAGLPIQLGDQRAEILQLGVGQQPGAAGGGRRAEAHRRQAALRHRAQAGGALAMHGRPAVEDVDVVLALEALAHQDVEGRLGARVHLAHGFLGVVDSSGT